MPIRSDDIHREQKRAANNAPESAPRDDGMTEVASRRLNVAQWSVWSAVTLVLVHTGLVIWAAWIHSPNVNEIAHLACGVSNWELGRFELYRVNPPIVRTIAAIPAVLMGCKTDWSRVDVATRNRAEFRVVPKFVELNGAWSYRYVILGRLMCIPFSWLGAWACFRWADQLYGRPSALLATALWCFSPNELALAAYMSPDGAASSLGIAAGYAFWRWLEKPSWGRSTMAGLLLGLTMLSKLTWVILLPLWPVIAMVCILKNRRRGQEVATHQIAAQFAACLLIAIHVLNSGYLYDGCFKTLESFPFISRALTGQTQSELAGGYGNRFKQTTLGKLPMPFPEQFVLGLDVQKEDLEQNRQTYFRGQMYDHGFWYYYIYGLGVKTPLGVFLVGLVALLNSRGRQLWTRYEWILPLHFVFFLAIVSSETTWNAHLRYAIPAMPFALVWTSRAALVFETKRRFLSMILVLGFVWFMSSSLWYSRHSLSYFNELAGGPSEGHWHLIDSNLDWGQDLFLLNDWLTRHPEVGRIGLAYYGHFNPSTIGIDFYIPKDDHTCRREPGWYAISATMMHGKSFWLNGPNGKQRYCEANGFIDFLSRTPFDRVGYSFFIFRIDE